MTQPFAPSLKAALFAGASAGIFAPLLWPFVVLVQQGRISDWHVLLSGLLAVAWLALLVGSLVALVIAFPVLLLLHKFALDRLPIIVFAGAAICTATIAALMSWSAFLWPLYAFAGALGGLCGLVAAWHMRSNIALQERRL